MYNRVWTGLRAFTANMNTAAVKTGTATETLILGLAALRRGNGKLAVSPIEMRGRG